MLETKYEMASNICEILRKIGCSGSRCGVWGTHFVLLPFTLQTSVKPYIIAGHLFISIKNLSLILGSFTDFEALFPLVSMDLQKLKKRGRLYVEIGRIYSCGELLRKLYED